MKTSTSMKNLSPHDKPFAPASPGRKGVKGLFGKVPKHIGEPLVPVTRRIYKEDSPPSWKNTYRGISKPSPSVINNRMNVMPIFRSMK